MNIKLGSLLNYWIYFGIVEFVLVALIYTWKIKKLQKFVRYAFGVILAVFLITNSVSLFLLYKAIKKSPLASYLLSGKDSFFLSRLELVAKDVGIVFVLAVLLYFAAYLVLRFQKRPLVEKEFPLILAIIALVAGLNNIIPVILLGFILAIIWQIIQLRKQERISLIPFLVFAAIAINVLNTFPFYQKFLENLHLV